MPDETRLKPKRGRILKILAILVCVLLLLVAAGYFVLTSSGFLKRVVLPKVGAALNATVTADDISLKPFSQVVVHNLKVETTGAEPLVRADQAVVRYDLMTILGGSMELNEVTLQSPVVQVRQQADGSSNLDPLLKKETAGKKTPDKEEPTRLAIRNLGIKNGTVRLFKTNKDNSTQNTELSGLNLNVSRVENAKPGKFDVAALLKLENQFPPGSGFTNSTAQGKINGAFEFLLDQELLPENLQGKTSLEITQGTGTFSDLAGLSSAIEADLTPSEIKQAALRFDRAGQQLGQVIAKGPVDLNKSEARLDVTIQSIDRQVLNLFGASRGWDFRNSKLNSTNQIEIAAGGARIAASGRISGSEISVQQNNQTTPTLNLDVDYKTSVDLNQQTVLLERVKLTGRQQGKDLLRANLDRPMSLTWGTVGAGLPDATFQLTLNQFDLKEWQPVIGTNLPTGKLDLQLTFRTGLQGKQLGTDLSAQVHNLAAQIGTNAIQNASLKVSASGQLTELKHLHLPNFQVELHQLKSSTEAPPIAKAAGSIRGDISTLELTVQTDAEVSLPTFLAQFPVSGITANQGTVKLNARIDRQRDAQSITGSAQLASLHGKFESYQFQDFQTALDYQIELKPDVIQIQRLHAAVKRGNEPGGTIHLAGTLNPTNNAAQLSFAATNLNQNALAPFFAPSLAGKKLVSISVNGQGNAGYDPNGESTLKADAKVANLVVADPKQPAQSEPLSAELHLDGSLRRQLLDLRQLQVALTPTPRGKNQVAMQGQLDFATTNPVPSKLTVQSESLDLTTYYDIFAGAGSTNSTTPVPQTAGRQNAEPEPMTLPFQQLTADLQIGQLYLRQIAVTNFQATAKINRGEVTLKPFQLSLNGAPVSLAGSVNVGVPGYIYDLSVQADKVPLEPLANSLMTNAAGAYKGDLIVNGKIKGAGVTGVNLRKNLSGQLDLSLTNLNLEIVGPKVRRLLEPVALALRVPELTQTPINWVSAQTQIGRGRIDLSQFSVLSHAFFADGKGTVQIAHVLTNSPLNIPVTLALRRSLAEKARLIPPNTPTNTAYVALPSFASIKGTLGEPKTDINERGVAAILLQTAGNIPQVGGKAGKILQGLGGILSGQRPVLGPTNAPPGTNTAQPPKTNPPPKINPLDLLRNLPLKK